MDQSRQSQKEASEKIWISESKSQAKLMTINTLTKVSKRALINLKKEF